VTKKEKIGVLKQERNAVVDLQAAHLALKGHSASCFANMLALLDGEKDAMELAETIFLASIPEFEIGLHEVTILAPVPRPRSIRDTLCYELHLIQANRVGLKRLGYDMDKITMEQLKPSQTWYEIPIYYKGNPASVVGHDADVYFPKGEEFRDFELELGFYIGKKCKDVSSAEATECIAGYTIFNDFSSRDIQLKEQFGKPALGPSKGKDFDTGNVMGPFLVTPDEFNPDNATMIARINGKEWGRGNSGTLYHKIPDIVSYISRSETLYPGDFIGLGTVGNGCGLELDRAILPGDIVELEIEGIGILRNRVVR
jgi:2-keto-4-pentenoate hydratase/2-oxohepta-3-ene-1,7-dioic acid hydratase in catechol pathway